MPGDLLPASTLLHPYAGEAQMLGFSRVRHLSSPHYRLAARGNHGVPIDPNIFNLAVVGRDHQEFQDRPCPKPVLVYEPVQGIGNSRSRRPQTRHYLRIAVKEKIDLFDVRSPDIFFGASIVVGWRLRRLS